MITARSVASFSSWHKNLTKKGEYDGYLNLLWGYNWQPYNTVQPAQHSTIGLFAPNEKLLSQSVARITKS